MGGLFRLIRRISTMNDPKQAPLYNVNASEPPHADDIDFHRIFMNLLGHKWLIIGVTVVCTLIGSLVAQTGLNVYRAQALLQVESKSGGVVGLGDIEPLFAQDSSVVTEIELLKSRSVIEEVVDALDLTTQVSPKLMTILGRHFYSNIYSYNRTLNQLAESKFSSYAWGGERLVIDELQVDDSLIGRTFVFTTVDDSTVNIHLNDAFIGEAQVGEMVSLPGIQFTLTDMRAHPETVFYVTKASKISTVKALTAQINAAERGKQSGMLNITVDSVSPEYAEKVLNELAQVYVNKNISRSALEATSSLEFLEARLPIIESSLKETERKLNEYQRFNETVDIASETGTLLEQIVLVESKISELQLQEKEIQRLYKQTHPAYEAFLSQKQELQSRKAAIQEDIKALPETQQNLLRLKRDVDVSTQIYIQLLNSIQELNILKAGTVGNVRIIDDAQVDMSVVVSPKRNIKVAIGCLFGLFISCGFVFLKGMFKRGIESPDEIAKLNVPVIAAVPYTPSLNKSNVDNHKESVPLVVREPNNPAVEAIRGIRTSVVFEAKHSNKNIIIITGPTAGIGKTFTSVNLAASLAQAGKKVLLMDMDLKRGTVHKHFVLDKHFNIGHYIKDECDYTELPVDSGIQHLDIVISGNPSSGSSEFLLSDKFQFLMEYYSEHYDYVVIDTPPILAISDALVISQREAQIYLVKKHAVNTISELKQCLSRLSHVGSRCDGVLVNVVKESSSYSDYYYYYSYQYGADVGK